MIAKAAPTASQLGGYARGLSLATVTVREGSCRAGAGSSGVAWGARVSEKYMEGSSGVDGGCMVPATPACLSIPVRGKIWLGGLRAVVPGTGESGVEALLPAVLANCTSLYVAVRGVGGGGAGAHVHMADSVAGTSIIERRLCRSGGMWRCRQERSVKPSAQPTLVRTQHLPHAAKMPR